MNAASTLALTELQHQQLGRHIYPGDGLEAAAIVLCSHAPPPRVRFITRKIIPVPCRWVG